MDPRVTQARTALDLGQVELAQALVPQAVAVAGREGTLLRARLAALTGNALEAQTLVEQARRESPDDARVYATCAEIYAAGGMLAEADREILRGIDAAGAASPELIRARGVHLICTPGQARPGLALLQRAAELDPELPFNDRPLAQAHMLVAKQQVAAGQGQAALKSVQLALKHDPADLDTRRLEAEVLMSVGEWGVGIERFEVLLLEGLPLEAEVGGYCKNAGFWAVTQGDRETGLVYYLRALELGFPREQLGHGLLVLGEEVTQLVGKGAEALAAGQLDEAGDLLRRALVCDPESLEVHNYLGHLYNLTGEYEAVVEHWSTVVNGARLAKLELPDPVHIQLARVLVLNLERFAEAREVLDAYLVLEPDGRWLTQTRELLDSLPRVKDESARGETVQDPGAGGA